MQGIGDWGGVWAGQGREGTWAVKGPCSRCMCYSMSAPCSCALLACHVLPRPAPDLLSWRYPTLHGACTCRLSTWMGTRCK